ncbi:FecR family protein [Thalassospira povalilytica]|uniref:FecR family protein n=1 Tax=Thalassospira povalilytica TaxID=732237 RepID=UPI003AA9ADFD
MSKLDLTPDPISEQAAYWFALLLEGNESAEDRKEFARWIDQDPRHKDAFSQIDRLWSGSSSLDFSPANPIGRRAVLGGSLAAILLAAGWGAMRYRPFADMTTETGQRREVTLPGNNGRSILASNTAISFVSDRGVPGVEIHSGEAWFEHNADRGDFFVVAKGGKSWSAGGRFDVAAYNNDVTVIAQTNSLQLELAGAGYSVPQRNALSYRGAEVVKPSHRIDVASALAWREGQLIFMGEPLEHVVAILERWQHGKIMVLGDHLKQRPVTLVVDLGRLHTVLPVLAKVLQVDVSQFTEYLTVIRDV